jgi:c-di-GMP-binding flagellar brake protein YcgR
MKDNSVSKTAIRSPFQNQPRLWERINLFVQKNGLRAEFVSRIEDIRSGSYVLEMPIRQNGIISLSKGDIVEVSYNNNDSVYTFKANITDLFEENGAITVEKRSEASRVQRRKFIRLDISGKLKFRTLNDSAGQGRGLGPETSGTLLNISAGGLLYECANKLHAQSLILLSFSLKSKHSLKNILAVVKRSEGSKNEGYLVGAEFITRSNYKAHGLEKLDEFLPEGCGTFDENLQKLVLRFIYDQQIEAKKSRS